MPALDVPSGKGKHDSGKATARGMPTLDCPSDSGVTGKKGRPKLASTEMPHRVESAMARAMDRKSERRARREAAECN